MTQHLEDKITAMTIHESGIYHIYNRGNNQQAIFYSKENYFYFLRKCHKYLKSCSDILAGCLMKNHFHFLISVTEKSLTPIKSGGITMPALTNGFRLLQSSYAKGINKELNRTGNLFQQKTKAKLVSIENSYALTAFYYIHQNPVIAGIVTKPEDYLYSSFPDYTGLRNGILCNKEKAIDLLGLSSIDLKVETMRMISDEKIKKLF